MTNCTHEPQSIYKLTGTGFQQRDKRVICVCVGESRRQQWGVQGPVKRRPRNSQQDYWKACLANLGSAAEHERVLPRESWGAGVVRPLRRLGTTPLALFAGTGPHEEDDAESRMKTGQVTPDERTIHSCLTFKELSSYFPKWLRHFNVPFLAAISEFQLLSILFNP